MDVSKPSDAPRPAPSLGAKSAKPEAIYAFVGSLAGPVLGLLFTLARVGPAGLVWWQGKGGETILTPLGRTILSVIIVIGGFAGAVCGWAFDSRYRPEIAAAKPKRYAPQEHLWDRDLDG
jgi:hypothetical protein